MCSMAASANMVVLIIITNREESVVPLCLFLSASTLLWLQFLLSVMEITPPHFLRPGWQYVFL